ncbi:NAD-specific glutamate dehydrogenase [compost metagenome]
MQARQTRGVFGALTLCIVEICGYGDHDAIEIAFKRRGCARSQGFQDIGRNANRVQQSGIGSNHRQAVFTRLELIRQMWIALLNIRQRAAHHAFNGADGVGRIFRRVGTRVISHRVALLLVIDDGRQQMTPFGVGQRFSLAATNGRHEGIGGA